MKPIKFSLGSERSEYSRLFKYSGNISHIKAYIEKNKTDHECIVEVFVRPLTTLERELYGLPARVPENQITGRLKIGKKAPRRRNKVEKRPGQISGADLAKWKASLQSSEEKP